MKKKELFVFFLLTSLVFAIYKGNGVQLSPENVTELSLNKKISSVQLEDHDSIVIDGNADFSSQASAEGWSGDGSPGDPYNISYFSITGYIKISNVDAHFTIKNCLIDGAYDGILFSNVTNAQIYNNTITNHIDDGIELDYSFNNSIYNNSIINNGWFGIYLTNSSSNNCINNNTIDGNIKDGITLDSYSNNNTITNNTNINNDGGILLWYSANNNVTTNNLSINDIDGIMLYHSSNNSLINNSFSDNGEAGIYLTGSSNNSFINNTIKDNDEDGIYLTGSSNNTFINNSIINNDYGVYLHSSRNNSFIKNTILTNTRDGIRLYWSSNNNTITMNVISYNHEDGIGVHQSDNTCITNNTITNNYDDGIYFDRSPNNCIKGNNITDGGLYIVGFSIEYFMQAEVIDNFVNSKPLVYWQSKDGGVIPAGAGQVILVNSKDVTINNQNLSYTAVGVHCYLCQELNITNNTISNNKFGIILHNEFSVAANNHITNNTITNNNDGIYTYESSNNYITDNTINDNDEFGIYLYASSRDNEISINIIDDNDIGIYLSSDSNENHVSDNTISNNIDVGIFVHNSYGNCITRNRFINNNPSGDSQANDSESTDTSFIANFWSDWTSPDSNNDGIVDNPYPIAGDTANEDPSPITNIEGHFLTAPTITNPTQGETISGTVSVQWTVAGDSLGHVVTYDVYYSADGGTTWNIMANGLSATSHTWDTSTVADGTNYRIKVLANCSHGLTTEVILGIFSIDNSIPTTTMESTTEKVETISSAKPSSEPKDGASTTFPSEMLILTIITVVIVKRRKKKEKKI